MKGGPFSLVRFCRLRLKSKQDGIVSSRRHSKAQKYSKNNYLKHLEKLFFSKKSFENFFFEKSIFISLNVFTNRKLQKNARGYPLIESENFRKKKSHSAKKTKKNQTKENLWSGIYFWKHKKFVV